MRPILLRLLPMKLRHAAYYRFYRNRRARWPKLFESAQLFYAPAVGMKLSPTDEGHGAIAFLGVYEYELTHKVVRLARDVGGLFVDVGANYGYFSLLWAAQRPDNRVIAFEASPRNHAVLEDNIRRNGFADRIVIRRVAAGRERGEMRFSMGPIDQSGWGGLAVDGGTNLGAVTTVPVVRIDEEISGEEKVSAMKVDIEGADAWAIMGAGKLIARRRIDRIFYEENLPRMRLLGINAGEAEKFLAAHGMTVNPMADPNEYEAVPT